jgi:apolipoprotein N-acyltransferase
VTSVRPLVWQALGAIAAGVALAATVQLEPIWWLAWVAPAAVLLLVLRAKPGTGGRLALAAGLLATSVLLPYLRSLMPTPIAVAIIVAMALLWRTTANTTRRAIERWHTAWAFLAFPTLWVGVDTLMAAILPDGNVLSYAYTQAAVLPVVQVAAVAGVGGVLFILMLANASLASLLGPRPRLPGTASFVSVVVALLAVVLLTGIRRVPRSIPDAPVTFGLAAIDDAIGVNATARHARTIRDQYDAHIATLAAARASVVVLPEKIAVLSAAQAAEWEQHFGNMARRHGVWLELGVAVDSTDGRRNLAWLFDPQGVRVARFHKHYMAPPERRDLPGRDFVTAPVAGTTVGLGICKDMHFAAFGRGYGALRAGAVLVPAWDFGRDAWWAQHATVVRGVENGFVVVRSAREGMLSVSDAYGRVVAERRSAAIPGVTLLATVPVGPPLQTPYTRTGDVLGWLCVVASVVLLLLLRRSRGA